MDPIIPPIWIYLINVFNILHGLSVFILILSVLGVFMAPLIADLLTDFGEERESKHLTKKIMKASVVIMIVCIVLLIFVPDRKTMYAMLAASMITPDNISGVENHVIDLISKIADGIYKAK